MKRKIGGFTDLLQDRLVLIGIGFGALFWIIESVMHVYVFDRLNLAQQLFSPGLHETWMRLIIVGMFVFFGLYAQRMISARKRAQKAVCRANAELTQIFETSADGMRVVDRNFTILRANETFCDMAGIKKEEAVGRKCHEVFRGARCRTERCPLTRILSGEERIEYDEEKIGKGGGKIPCIVTATPFRGHEEELIGIVEDFKDISERKRVEENLRKSRLRLRELASHMESTREKERTRIAREIHDELGQALTALKMEVHWLAGRLPQDAPSLAEKAKEICDIIDMHVHMVQRISSELRPGLLDNLGLSAAIEWQADQVQARTGVECKILSEPEDMIIDATRSTALFRIFQEALTNVVRHAEATRVDVRLLQSSGEVELEVFDNGRGISEDELRDEKSFGIMGIRERVHTLGGTVTIRVDRKGGTRVHVKIPTEERGEDPC
jgi:PAS domain S-box-containing protein